MHLFSELIKELVNSLIGARLDMSISNIVIYADDLVLMASSIGGVQKLSDTAENKANSLWLSLIYIKVQQLCFFCNRLNKNKNNY